MNFYAGNPYHKNFRPRLVPYALQEGDTIAIVSPAAPSPPAALEKGKTLLEEAGYRVKIMPNAAKKEAYLAGSDAQRASDIMAAFSDPEVDAILCARGGYGCARLLPHLDLSVVEANPKLFMGFSDITVLLNVFYEEAGLLGFYSPMLTSNLIEPDQEFTWQSWQDAISVQGCQVPYEVPNQDPYTCLQAGLAEGPLRGGNLSLLASLCGTPWQPNFTGAVVFIEDWKECYYTLDRKVNQLIQAGLLTNIAGLLLCDFSQIPEEPERTLTEQLAYLTRELGVPVGYGFTIGHGEQTATIPFGVQVRFEAEAGRLTVLEAGVRDRSVAAAGQEQALSANDVLIPADPAMMLPAGASRPAPSWSDSETEDEDDDFF